MPGPRQIKRQRQTHFVIGVGGQTKGLTVEKMEFSTEDEEYDPKEFPKFEDYVKYCLNDEIADFNQHFATAISIDENEALTLIQELSSVIM